MSCLILPRKPIENILIDALREDSTVKNLLTEQLPLFYTLGKMNEILFQLDLNKAKDIFEFLLYLMKQIVMSRDFFVTKWTNTSYIL